MNILLINHYAGNPELGMEFRPYYLAKEWVKQGHNVYVVAASYSHLRTKQPKISKSFTTEIIDGINYIWLKTPPYSSSGIRRFINMLSFVFKLFYYKNKLIKISEPDVVIASSTYPLDIYPARSISKKTKAKLCFELHDLWPLSPMEIGGYSKYHPFIMLIQAGENYACKNSDVIISLLGNAKPHLMKHGMHLNKFHHITNGFDMDEYTNCIEDIPVSHKKLLSLLKEQNKFIIGYSGGINPSNAMMAWIQAAKLLSKNDQIIFVSVGTGQDLINLQNFKEENNLSNIYFLEFVSKRSISSLLSYFDIAYVGFVSSILHRYGIAPNKLTDYMLAGKPVILSADVENEIVERVGCGITIPAENSVLLKDAIMQIKNMTEKERFDMGMRGKKYALKELNYENLSKKFIEILQNL
jgi:glycosyltransferase involved in cell wall biosynthesis